MMTGEGLKQFVRVVEWNQRNRCVELLRDILGDGSQDSYYWSGHTAGLRAAIQAIEAEEDEKVVEKHEEMRNFGGYAPGDYMCKCRHCDERFMGDKRAFACFKCAFAPLQNLMSEAGHALVLVEKEDKS